MRVTPPLVPRGTLRHGAVTSTGEVGERIPSSLLRVSAAAAAYDLDHISLWSSLAEDYNLRSDTEWDSISQAELVLHAGATVLGSV